MGCTSSKLDDLPAVALCRERCTFLDEAIHQRYALAAAHVSYINSLTSIGHSLHSFIQHDHTHAVSPPPSPPPKNKNHHLATKHSSPSPPHSDSGGSHLHFHSDSDSDDELNHHDDDASPSPLHLPHKNHNTSTGVPGGGGYYNNYNNSPPHHQMNSNFQMNFMKNKPPPPSSIVYEQRPMSNQTVYVGESSSSFYNPYQQQQQPYQQPNPYNNNNYYGGYPPPPSSSSFYGSSPPPPMAASSKPPPAPPSPPKTSTWDFLNFFDSDDKYYPQTQYTPTATPSRDSKEPKPKPKVNSAFRPGSRNPLEVAKEIQILFQRASDSGSHIADILEVGKLRYHHKATSKMLHLVAPSLSVVSSASRNAQSTEPNNMDLDVELTTRSRNLSSTLHKLYLWEKKLYNEVKAEEKMRVVHDRKCRKLKRLDEKGADFNKVDSTRAFIRDLSTKISMAINVVDKISMTINKIRDEELWPQLKGLIQGFNRMWKSMLECHHSQCEAIREARILGSIASRKKSGDSHLLATKQLEQELINWTFQFAGWVSAQKGYVRALNNWLLKCLLYEPEETSDGIVPFSPGRIGAPPIFVICNQWSQALDRISEKEVVETMHVFTMSVLHIWEQDKLELHQQLTQNKDLERKVRNIDRDDQKLQKQIQALERKIVMTSGDGKGLSVSENIIYQSDKSSNLQASLQRIFEAMERFTDESVKAYEELIQRTEEESAPRNHE
ncbi:hypothetical protein TSUD_254770 [Trifolium subterraneum]|uniref:DUF632 domain-containing protein n=1 Tax=Trifolium subterraneum TaxID=3900 RepID=A0A2Z6NFS4_TRISU|nr:hypothetical protein TSUD_254770 [Trifolium subterraneum]